MTSFTVDRKASRVPMPMLCQASIIKELPLDTLQAPTKIPRYGPLNTISLL